MAGLPPSEELVAIHDGAALKSFQAFLNLRSDLRTSLFEQARRKLRPLVRRQPFEEPLFQQPPTFGLLKKPKTVTEDFTRRVIPPRRNEVLNEPLQLRSDRNVHAASDGHTPNIAHRRGCVKF